jgi:sigma-B regulation protein RsbU (phosphoserine phosphatase)
MRQLFALCYFASRGTCATLRPSMEGWIFAVVLLLAGAAVSLLLLRSLGRERRVIREMQQGDHERAARRRRVFEVLQVLGDAIQAGQSDATIHRLIAEGAIKVVEADGAALYLFDEKTQSLVPKHYTKNCPPLIALPERIVEQARTNASTLPSFLRLHSIKPGEGVLGSVFQSLKEENVPDLRHHAKFDGASNPFQQHVAALIAPLKHGTRGLGVLVAASEKSRPFTQHELEMFDSLAEQCGFALGNAQAHHEAGAKRALESELKNASEIQRILLPEKAPETPGFELAGQNIPAKMVSGDYFDFVPIGETHVGVTIADVSGKGIPAALLTAMCRSVLRAKAPFHPTSPAAALAALNRNLFPDIREDMFITIAYAVLPKDSGTVTLARAGHTDPLVWRSQTGEVEVVKSGGLAVGVDKGDVFERVTKDVAVTMESGDVLLLYTDGINEATDHKGLEFGEERIKTVLGLAAPNGAQAVVEALCDAVKTFSGSEAQADDITLVVVRRK